MSNGGNKKRFVTNFDKLPPKYPTHAHQHEFWEQLGRTVASFGFLEEVLGKAIYLLTATRAYPDDEIQEELEKWYRTLEHALTDQLHNLIEKYVKTLREHPDTTLSNIDDLRDELLKIPPLRNVLCHASWRMPDETGASIPYYFNRQMEKFETPVGIPYLVQIQTGTVELATEVINTITHMGYQFPGSNGPGEELFKK